ncbi:MAG: hypothetical protein KGD58_02265 [Candidatus Lokiarchaeota archaeon]|nr:hypothetical protein [Candidatus Lokiarchaeota archaeon]
MFKDFFQLYQIGKDLGLTKKEIKDFSLFGNTKHPFLYSILLVLSIIAIGISIILGIYIERSTYASGSYYSTVKKNDFKLRK